MKLARQPRPELSPEDSTLQGGFQRSLTVPVSQPKLPSDPSRAQHLAGLSPPGRRSQASGPSSPLSLRSLGASRATTLGKGSPQSPRLSCSPRKAYPADKGGYRLEEEIGHGATAVVWRAQCLALGEEVAVKIIDLERRCEAMEAIFKECQVMSMLWHPNLVRAHAFFSVGQQLWVVMPFCDAGSVLHIMKACHADGLEEHVVATVLRETLKAVDYLHHKGLIHRDIKAGNILLTSSGAVKVADFGVSGFMFDTGDRLLKRNTLVGSPCWMAPEVLEGRNGYDFKADIWSFGITALELAHGHAPFERMPPMKILMSTLQGPTPGLDKDHEKKFSKAFKEMVAMCLVKDPSKRPSAEKLLLHPFFKHAKTPDYLVKHLLKGLPSLGERVRKLKAEEAALLATSHLDPEAQRCKSMREYQLGVSEWNFNVHDLKQQAALLRDDEGCEDDTPSSSSSMDGTTRLPTSFPPRSPHPSTPTCSSAPASASTPPSSSSSLSSTSTSTSSPFPSIGSTSYPSSSSFAFPTSALPPSGDVAAAACVGPGWGGGFYLGPSRHEAQEEQQAREEELSLLARGQHLQGLREQQGHPPQQEQQEQQGQGQQQGHVPPQPGLQQVLTSPKGKLSITTSRLVSRGRFRVEHQQSGHHHDDDDGDSSDDDDDWHSHASTRPPFPRSSTTN